MSKPYKYLKFKQYGDKANDADTLLMFAAKAKDLYAWAGIPRKGWHIRMLFQRPITSTRENELIRFWENASGQSGDLDPIVGPTAIIVAIQDGAKTAGDEIDLSYECPVDLLNPNIAEVCSELAKLAWDRVVNRIDKEQRDILKAREADPFADLHNVENDYVFEFAMQLQQMITDSARFFEENSVSDESKTEIIEAMEAILRPAIVVDGQHRLFGAANVSRDIVLPVVAIPHCPWTEQIYQFVVINEKAQRVEQSLLGDIFGSSITHQEQRNIRDRFARLNVDIESRIAATTANREPSSPFRNMVVVKMTGQLPADVRPYLSERTIRVLIDGTSQKYSQGWRTDEAFYDYFVQPTFPNKDDWDKWSGGAWRDYWFTFWDTVKTYYNAEAARLGREPLWSSTTQTNLTKAVTLRQLQTLFMINCVESMKRIDENREILVEALGSAELADAKIAEQKQSRAIPEDLESFREFVLQEFLSNGIPVKVFTATWKTSLDDAQGQDDLWEVLFLAFSKSRRGEAFHVRGRIFDTSESER
jgi:hypothetical protein